MVNYYADNYGTGELDSATDYEDEAYEERGGHYDAATVDSPYINANDLEVIHSYLLKHYEMK